MSKNFNIQETVHRNIEKNQFPSFSNHRSLVGWCSMNYPKALVNPIYLQKQPIHPDRKYQLESIFQAKNPIERQKNEFVKPFENYSQVKEDQKTQGQEDTRRGKQSCLTLATTKHDMKAKIFEENNKLSEKYSAVKPMGNILGSNRDGHYERKVRQIGQVYYNPPNEGELMRHLKKLPNTVINEHNLLEVMNSKLTFLDLQYKNDISNELINKIGYLAENIQQLVLTAVPITNEVLIELGISCKHLTSIDISLCKLLEEFAIVKFLKSKPKLEKLSVNHNQSSFTDSCLEIVGKSQCLDTLNMNFCKEVTSAGIEAISHLKFKQLSLSSLPYLKAEDFNKLLAQSSESLLNLNMSFNNGKDINNQLMVRVGMCIHLQSLILTGCENISDEGINNLIYGDKVKGKHPEGFNDLETFKIGGLINISDNVYQFCKRCPALTFLEANNLERLTDHFIDQIKTHPTLKSIMINFTPNISEQKVKEVRETNKGLNLIRSIAKMTDPGDDGLRMPIPPASLKIKKPKKKKK